MTDPDFLAGEERSADSVFDGTGATRDLLDGTDWAATPLGPVSRWPGELIAAIRTVLPSRIPMLLWWGPELVQVYNEPFTALLGRKHPQAMGQPAMECWSEIRDIVGPMAQSVLDGDESTYSENLLLFLDRHGYVEETYWTFSYSPIRGGDGKVVGIFVATTDVTSQTVAARRLRTLRELGTVSAAQAGTAAQACRAALALLESSRVDVPFAIAYLRDERNAQQVVAEASFGARASSALPSEDAMHRVLSGNGPELISGIQAAHIEPFDAIPHPGVRSDQAMLLPLVTAGRDLPIGVLMLGLTPYRALDDHYRTFLDLISRQVSTAVTDAIALDEERRRAQSLAELDAAKTRFFQNISHEFRTPLTLLLAPLRGLLDEHEDDLPAGHREAMRAAHRAALRLERMVDALLTVTYGEANQLQASPEPTNLAALTADCAAMFRSAIEHAGLELRTDIGQICGPVMVDRDMWTNIVLNLLSNAVKFTHAGSITLRLSVDEGRNVVELAVADTGVGIPEEEVPQVFERFHQVPTAPGRSREGSGIGLSLVADLTKALGGSISVASTLGQGSTFTVTVPHIAAPSGRRSESRAAPSIDAQAAPFVEEALMWGSPADGAQQPAPTRDGVATEARTTFTEFNGSGRVLLVEDNADMRAYLRRLLVEQGWTVDTAAHGREALACAEAMRPDLVLADVMMPEMDGIALLEALRADPSLSRVPVVLLTARAGPESAIEGLRQGADDYVVKPFDPAELLARVRVHLELAQLRELLLASREREAAQLREALENRTVIGQAVGLVMSQRSCDTETAFAFLARVSQSRNIKVRDLAREIIDLANERSTKRRKRT